MLVGTDGAVRLEYLGHQYLLVAGMDSLGCLDRYFVFVREVLIVELDGLSSKERVVLWRALDGVV